MSNITEQIQHTLNIAKVTAQARVNQPCVGAHAAVPHHSTYVVSLRWTHRMMTMTSRRWRVGQCAGSADQPLALLNQLQPTYVRCRGKPGSSLTA
jgi:hypothetical protein